MDGSFDHKEPIRNIIYLNCVTSPPEIFSCNLRHHIDTVENYSTVKFNANLNKCHTKYKVSVMYK